MSIKVTRQKSLEASLVLVVASVILYFKFDKEYFLYIGLGLGVVGILIAPLAELIARFWYKLGEVLGAVVSRILLSVVYSFLLLPLALVYRVFNRDPLQLRPGAETYWKNREHLYKSSDLEKPW